MRGTWLARCCARYVTQYDQCQSILTDWMCHGRVVRTLGTIVGGAVAWDSGAPFDHLAHDAICSDSWSPDARCQCSETWYIYIYRERKWERYIYKYIYIYIYHMIHVYIIGFIPKTGPSPSPTQSMHHNLESSSQISILRKLIGNMVQKYFSARNIFFPQEIFFSARNIFFSARNRFFPQEIYFSPQEIYFSPQEIYFFPQELFFSARTIFFRKKYFSPQEIYFSPQEIYFFRKK